MGTVLGTVVGTVWALCGHCKSKKWRYFLEALTEAKCKGERGKN